MRNILAQIFPIYGPKVKQFLVCVCFLINEKQKKNKKKLINDLEGDIDSYVVTFLMLVELCTHIFLENFHFYKKGEGKNSESGWRMSDGKFSMSQNILPLA